MYSSSASVLRQIQEECNFLRGVIESLKTTIQGLAAKQRMRHEQTQERKQHPPPPLYSFASAFASASTKPLPETSSRMLPGTTNTSSQPSLPNDRFYHPTQIPMHARSSPLPPPLLDSSSPFFVPDTMPRQSSSSFQPVEKKVYNATLYPKTVYFVNENGRTNSLIANNPVFFRNRLPDCSLGFDVFNLAETRNGDLQPLAIRENILVYFIEYAAFQRQVPSGEEEEEEENVTLRNWKRKASSQAALVLYAILVPIEAYVNNEKSILEAVYASPYNILIVYQKGPQKQILTAPLTACNTILRAYDYILQNDNNIETISSRKVSFPRDIGIYAATSSFRTFDEGRLKTLSLETCQNEIHFHYLQKRVDDSFTKTDVKGEGILATILLPLAEYKGDEIDQVRQQYDAICLREFLPALARERNAIYMEVYVLFENSPLPTSRYPHVIFYMNESGLLIRQSGSFCNPLPPNQAAGII